jgi:hypothetical protein
MGNIAKFRAVFGQLVSVTDQEIKTLEKRNLFMHGDIENIEGQEMIDIMQMQLSFIYRLLLSYVGFEGFVINHYSLRNESADKAFVKIN